MPEIQGKVQYLKVGDDFCFAQVKEEGTGDLELSPIWCYLSDDPKPPSYKRSIQNMQFELLRTSLLQGLTVIIQWDESTGLPQNIKLLAAP